MTVVACGPLSQVLLTLMPCFPVETEGRSLLYEVQLCIVLLQIHVLVQIHCFITNNNVVFTALSIHVSVACLHSSPAHS